jgi:hypothetical protein
VPAVNVVLLVLGHVQGWSVCKVRVYMLWRLYAVTRGEVQKRVCRNRVQPSVSQLGCADYALKTTILLRHGRVMESSYAYVR